MDLGTTGSAVGTGSLADPALPAAASLLDASEARAALRPVVAAHAGRLDGLAVTGVRYQRGRRLAVRYRAHVAWPGGDRVETAVLLAERGELPAGAAVLEGGAGERIAAWLYPSDPFLPGLPSAASPEAVRGLLRSLGAPEGAVSIRPRVYRPTSRAVLEVSGGARAFLKVVRPQQAAALHALHESMAPRLPVPRAHGYSDAQGIVVLEARPGRELGAALIEGQSVPAPQELLDLLDRISGLPAPADRLDETPALQAASYSSALAAILPDQAQWVREIGEAAAEGPWDPDRTVHGDFYEAQILVAEGRVSTLLDVDRTRRGDALDDLATLLAHLDVLAWHRPDAAERIGAYRGAVAELAARRGPRDSLARRVATALLGLAAWPFRSQQPDWRLRTEALVAMAAAAIQGRDEEGLTGLSPSSHHGRPASKSSDRTQGQGAETT